jgi:hypothetical protein
MRKLAVVVACLVATATAIAGLAACGSSNSSNSPREEVVRATTDFFDSFIDRDPSAACDAMSNNLIAKFTALAGTSDCKAVLEEALPKIPDERVRLYEEQVASVSAHDVRIDGGKASVSVPGEVLTLVLADGKWLVDSTGSAAARIDPTEAEDQLSEAIEESGTEAVSNAECPDDQPVEPGETFFCEVEFPSGQRARATIRITDSSGALEVVKMRPR